MSSTPFFSSMLAAAVMDMTRWGRLKAMTRPLQKAMVIRKTIAMTREHKGAWYSENIPTMKISKITRPVRIWLTIVGQTCVAKKRSQSSRASSF